MLEPPLLPNLLYMILMAGLWLVALAIVTPGTGLLEGLAVLALVAAGLGTMIVPVNSWALLPLGVGLALFVVSVWRAHRGIWLLASAVVLTIGSAFLFGTEAGGPAVNPWLALVSSAFTVGFFWLVVRTTMEAMSSTPTHDLARVVGQVGELRTAIDPTGSAYIAGELWTVTARDEIPVGSNVRVVGREGLVLVVERAAQP